MKTPTKKAGKSATKNSFRTVIRKHWKNSWTPSLSWLSKENPTSTNSSDLSDPSHKDQQQKKMRPITKTDSASTLIDVHDNEVGKVSQQHQQDANDFGVRTFHKINDESTSLYLDETTTLSMPVSPYKPLHEALSSHPLISNSASEVLQTQSIYTFEQKHARKDTPVIYVHQREVASVSSEQYNNHGAVLVTDAATTCHVFALRSISRAGEVILGSLCHLDSTDNETCIRKMFQEHVDYHFNEENMVVSNERFLMEVHIAGGYNDSKGTSSRITDFLMLLLRKISRETESFMKIQINTCLVSGLNDTIANKEATFDLSLISTKGSSSPSPIVRGLAMDVCTGKISVLQRVHQDLVGPQPILRRVRLWTSSPCTERLFQVHNHTKEEIIIKPFTFEPFEGMEMMISLPDDIMLDYCSTSPECEGPDFCDQIRETCEYLMNVGVDDVFGAEMKTLKYGHKQCSEWKLV